MYLSMFIGIKTFETLPDETQELESLSLFEDHHARTPYDVFCLRKRVKLRLSLHDTVFLNGIV